MPDDRFLHKRAGHSEKFALLTDFEWRVWCQFLMSADDFGVMRYSALTLQEANDAFETRPADILEHCLNELVTVRLVHTFEHQRRLYLYQWDWQFWQKVTFPRRTLSPKPPEELCSRHTRWLLSHHPGGKPMPSWMAPNGWRPEVVDPDPLPALPKRLESADQVEGNNFSDAIAVSRLPLAVGFSAKPPKPEKHGSAEKPPSGVREFLEWFVTEYKARRNGATYFVKWEVHGKLVKELLRVFPAERLKKHALILLTTDEDWTSDTDRGIGILSTKINWLEERLCAWEAKTGRVAHG